MKITIDSTTKSVIKSVTKIIGDCYLVGGSVRDLALGKTPKDYDFSTPLSPDEVETRVRDFGLKAYTIGKKYGTIGFKIDGQYIEVTTFRTEQYKSGNRRPNVTFTKNITHDLSRRDFTVNAMAINSKYKLIDPFEGLIDLKNGVIRTVGLPFTRFNEDPLRILRAFRFMAETNFVIEESTLHYCQKLAHKILTISTERVSQEFDRILVADNAEQTLRLIGELKILNYTLPLLSIQVGYDQNSSYHRYTLWEHTIKTVSGLPKDITLRWSGLLHDIGKPFVRTHYKKRARYVHHDIVGARLVEAVAIYLRWSNERRDQVIQLVAEHMKYDSPLRHADNSAKIPAPKHED